MREVKAGKGTRWLWLASVAVGIGVFLGVAAVVPGAHCADGTQSSAIGRRGACSHHGGVTGGWTFVGVPAGLFAGIGTLAALEALLGRHASRRREKQLKEWHQAQASVRVSGTLGRRPGEDRQAFIRRVIAAGRWVTFAYRDHGTAELRERTVRPRWLQLSEIAGERTLCLVGDCAVDGQRTFALSRMEQLRAAEPAQAAT